MEILGIVYAWIGGNKDGALFVRWSDEPSTFEVFMNVRGGGRPLRLEDEFSDEGFAYVLTGPDTIVGVFVLRTASEQGALNALRATWGEATQLRKDEHVDEYWGYGAATHVPAAT